MAPIILYEKLETPKMSTKKEMVCFSFEGGISKETLDECAKLCGDYKIMCYSNGRLRSIDIRTKISEEEKNNLLQTMQNFVGDNIEIKIWKRPTDYFEYDYNKRREEHKALFKDKVFVDITHIGYFGKFFKNFKNGRNLLQYLEHPNYINFETIFFRDLALCQAPMPNLIFFRQDREKYYLGGNFGSYGDYFEKSFYFAFSWPFIIVTFIPGTIIGSIVGSAHWLISNIVFKYKLNKYRKELDSSMKELYKYVSNMFNEINITSVLLPVSFYKLRGNKLDYVHQFIIDEFGEDHPRFKDISLIIKAMIVENEYDKFCLTLEQIRKCIDKLTSSSRDIKHKEIALMCIAYILGQKHNLFENYSLIKSYIEPSYFKSNI